jgi:hypothetical protein
MSQTPGPSLSGYGGYGTSGYLTGRQSTGLYQWGVIVGAGVLSLTVAGKLWRPALVLAKPAATRLFVAATSPVNWALYNAYREAGDLAHWARGGEMELGISITGRPWTTPGGTLIVPFLWLDIQPSQSSGGGGPGGLPNLHQPPPSIEETGEILTSAGQIKPTWVPPSKTKSPSRFKKAKYCPRGYYWSRSRRKCLPLEGANDYRRFKRRYRKKG